MVEVRARSEHSSSRGVRSKFFFRREWIRRFPGVSVQRLFFFHRAYSVDIFFCGEIMTQRLAQQRQQQCTEHATTNWLQRYNATAPSSSRQHHARVTDSRCTVSSCFGKHARSVTHHIYSYQLSRRLFLFCFVRHKARTPPHTTAAVERARYNQHPYRAQQPQATPCACDRYALYTLYSVKLFCRT